MNSDHLFVYGTLMRGFDHPMAKLLSRSADFLGEARCRGRLYLVKHYPGLVLSDEPGDVVFGELLSAAPARRIAARVRHVRGLRRGLCRADRIYQADAVRDVATTARPSEAWTYVYNWPVDRLPRIASGRFLEE